MKLESAKHKLGYYEFLTWGDFLKHCETNAGKNTGHSKQPGSHWNGWVDFEAAMRLARDGWQQGADSVAQMSTTILNKVTGLIEREQVVYDVEGIGLDVATYLNGEPECWQRFDTELREGEGSKHLRVVFNTTVSGGIGADVIEARGAAVAALVQALEFAGRRVELWGIAVCAQSYKGSFEARVQVKAADQDLDMSRVAYALAHPSMLRRMGFACVEADDVASYRLGYGYGRPCDTDNKGDIYVNEGTLGEVQWSRPASAINWVLAKLKEQGVNLVTT